MATYSGTGLLKVTLHFPLCSELPSAAVEPIPQDQSSGLLPSLGPTPSPFVDGKVRPGEGSTEGGRSMGAAGMEPSRFGHDLHSQKSEGHLSASQGRSWVLGEAEQKGEHFQGEWG